MQITLYIENKNCIESYEKLSNSLKSKFKNCIESYEKLSNSLKSKLFNYRQSTVSKSWNMNILQAKRCDISRKKDLKSTSVINLSPSRRMYLVWLIIL